MRIGMPIAILAAAFSLLCAAPAGAVVDVAGWELTDLSAAQIPITFRLAFDEQRIAWPRWDGGQTDVYVVDVATGTTTQITATPESEESVDLDGSRLVWLARTSEDLSAPVEVRLHDLETNETRVIGSGRVQLESGPLLVGDHVALGAV